MLEFSINFDFKILMMIHGSWAFFRTHTANYLKLRNGHNAFFYHIHCHGEGFPEIKGIQIALIGVANHRGAAADHLGKFSPPLLPVKSEKALST